MKANAISHEPTSPEAADIRAIRLAAGLTQTEAGRLLYSSCRTFQKWESGDAPMHPAMFELFNLKMRAIMLKPVISKAERAARIEAIDYGRASVRLEGYVATPEYEALAQRFIDGEFTQAEYTKAVIALSTAQWKAAQAAKAAA